MASPSKQIETFCPGCKEIAAVSTEGNFQTVSAHCPHCKHALLEHCTEAFYKNETLNQCASCGCANLFRQKDFNRRLGVLILIVGIGLSFFTYGISLAFVTVLDLFLYWKVKEVAVCYQCSAVYRGFQGVKNLEPFQLVLHDHYRISV